MQLTARREHVSFRQVRLTYCPRSGAVLVTGYLGGAIATQVRVNESWFNILFPLVFGSFVWGGLYLRDRRLKSLLARDAGRLTRAAIRARSMLCRSSFAIRASRCAAGPATGRYARRE